MLAAVFKVYYQRLQAAINKTHPRTKAEKIANYQLKINEQAERIDTLSMENKTLSHSAGRAKSKNKTTFIVMVIAIIVAVVSIIMHFVI